MNWRQHPPLSERGPVCSGKEAQSLEYLIEALEVRISPAAVIDLASLVDGNGFRSAGERTGDVTTAAATNTDGFGITAQPFASLTLGRARQPLVVGDADIIDIDTDFKIVDFAESWERRPWERWRPAGNDTKAGEDASGPRKIYSDSSTARGKSAKISARRSLAAAG